jgi:hypothetical protein
MLAILLLEVQAFGTGRAGRQTYVIGLLPHFHVDRVVIGH